MEDKSDEQNLDKLPIWTQGEMISAVFGGIMIGIAIGLIFKWQTPRFYTTIIECLKFLGRFRIQTMSRFDLLIM